MIDRIAIVSLPVSDQAASKRFYTEVLGFAVLRDNPMGPDQRWVQVGPAGGGASFTLVTWFDSMPAGSVSGIVLETADIAADVARLKGLGLTISDVDSQPWGTFATFEDPDGNGFVLQQSAGQA
ncbi:MAG: VOC family protein [Alphaproteobacteria bacterium]|nr:VOC family protein [Alphaproteobacteria bacterium]